MTLPSFKTFRARVMDILFGKRIEPAAAPPIWIGSIHGWLSTLAGLVVLFCIFTRRGWLPVRYSPTIEMVENFAMPVLLVLIFGWHFIVEHYQRRAKARMIPAP